MLKELLESDWGYKLDIAGGSGKRLDPVEILSDDEDEASLTELLVLRGLGKGRRVMWRTMGIGRCPDTQLVKRTIETKDVLEDEIITQQESYYFDRKIPSESCGNLSANYVVFSEPNSGFRYPYEVSWLKFDGLTDYNDKGRPDLGFSLAYNTPGMTATIYTYPKISSDINDDSLALEMQSSIDEIKLLHGDDAISHDWGIRDEEGMLIYYFLPKYEDNKISVTMFAEQSGQLIKARCTLVDEPFMRDICAQFVTAFTQIVRQRSAESTLYING